MRGLIKRVNLLDDYSKWIIRISILFIFVTVFELLGYFGGVLDVIEGRGLVSVTNSFLWIINSIQYIASALIGLSPVVCAILLYMSYSRVIYDTKYKSCIIPKSNKDKLLSTFKIYGIWILVYFVMNLILYLTIYNVKGVGALEIIGIILQGFVFVTFLALAIIIMDMDCKDSSLKKGATAFWNIMAIVFSQFILTISLSILAPFKFSEIISYSVVLFIVVVEGIYILKRVDKVKVN